MATRKPSDPLATVRKLDVGLVQLKIGQVSVSQAEVEARGPWRGGQTEPAS
jgi:hypothetical protein